MKNSKKTYRNISWLPQNATLDILLSKDNLKQEIEIGKTTAVFAFIINKKNNEIILLEHSNKKRGYDIPGGHIERGETLIESLKREVLEETGAFIKNINLVGYQVITKDSPEEKYPDLLSNQAFFVADLDFFTNIELAPDSQGVIKMDLKEFEYLITDNKEIYYKELFKEIGEN